MNVRIVLVGARHPGNIGSTARAMKTMGLVDLALVAPERYPAPEAVTMAAAADDVLARARVFATVPEAVADCGLIVGTTARPRHLPWRVVEPREAAPEIVAAAKRAPVALLFGAERTGLSNDDLEQCHRLLTIPCDEAYASLNLAMAVQVVAYELWLAAREPRGGGRRRRRGPACVRAGNGAVLRAPRAGARRDRFPGPHGQRTPDGAAAALLQPRGAWTRTRFTSCAEF